MRVFIFPHRRHAVCAALLACLCVLAAPALGAIAVEQENNDRDTRANGPLGSGVAVEGRLANANDIDWFRFDLSAPGTVQLRLDHAAGDDFDWALYRETGGAVVRGETANVPETGSYAAPAAARYFVKLTSYRGSGDYALTVSWNGSGGGGDPRPSKPSGLRSWITGNAGDSGRTPQGGPGMLLMGGNFDIDEAFLLHAWPVVNGGDVVVLRTSGSDGYNDYLYTLDTGALQPDSVETLLLDTRAKANSDYAEWVVRNAELLWIAGGDQSDYVNTWKDTRTADAIEAAYARGAVIGGISAGLAMQGEYVYDPDGVPGVTSAEALADPYRGNLLFTTGFLDLPLMRGIVTDSHFRERDRMGRLLAFMARLREDGTAPAIVGIGIDEDTSLFIDRDGFGAVDGDGAAYVIGERADTARTQVAPGQPLVYRGLRRTRLRAGDLYDFTTGTGNGDTVVLDVDARDAQPFTPPDPY